MIKRILFLLSFCACAQAYHPKIFFDSTTIAGWRAAATTTHADMYNYIHPLAVDYLNDDIPAYPNGDCWTTVRNTIMPKITAMAFEYVITQDTNYSNRVRDYLLSFTGWELWGWNEPYKYCKDFALSHMILVNAISYDWVYNDLSTTERDSIKTFLAGQVDSLYLAAIGDRNNDWNNFWNRHYSQNHCFVNFAIIGLAALVLEGEDARTTNWQNRSDSTSMRLKDVMHGIFDGSWHEGIQYQTAIYSLCLPYYVALKSLKNIDVVDSAYTNNMVNWRIAAYRPDSVSSFPHSTYAANGDNLHGGSSVFHYIADRYGNGYSQWYADKLEENNPKTAYDLHSYVWGYFCYDPSVSAVSPAGTKDSTGIFFPDLQEVVWRTGWSDTSIVFSFKNGQAGGNFCQEKRILREYPWETVSSYCQVNVGHNHYDINTFYLSKGAFDLSSEHWGTHDSTKWHNSLMVDGGTQYMTRYNSSYDSVGGEIDILRNSKNFNYLRADATNLYRYRNSNDLPGYWKLNNYKRHVLWNKPEYMIIVDDIKSDSVRRYDYAQHFSTTCSLSGDWIKGVHKIGSDSIVTGVCVALPSDFIDTIGNDGKPYIKIRPSDNQDTTKFAMVMFPQMTTLWTSKPAVSILADSVHSIVCQVDYNGPQDNVINLTDESISVGDYTLNGSSGIIQKDSAGVIRKIVLCNGSSFYDAEGDRVLISTTAENSTVEAVYGGDSIHLTVDSVSNLNIKIIGPSSSEDLIYVNDTLAYATKTGDTITIEGYALNDWTYPKIMSTWNQMIDDAATMIGWAVNRVSQILNQMGGYTDGTESVCTLTVSTSTGGTVDPSGDVVDTCGDNISIAATADASPSGYAFWKWTRSGPEVVLGDSSESSTIAVLTSNATVTANFTCAALALSYTPDTLACTLGVPMGPISATITGTADSVTVSPALPVGGSLVKTGDGMGELAIVGQTAKALTRYIFTAHSCRLVTDTMYINVRDTTTSIISATRRNNPMNTGINISIP